jgi:hypothetical protein
VHGCVPEPQGRGMLVSVDLGGGTIASVVGVYASAQIEDRRWRNVPNRGGWRDQDGDSDHIQLPRRYRDTEAVHDLST